MGNETAWQQMLRIDCAGDISGEKQVSRHSPRCSHSFQWGCRMGGGGEDAKGRRHQTFTGIFYYWNIFTCLYKRIYIYISLGSSWEWRGSCWEISTESNWGSSCFPNTYSQYILPISTPNIYSQYLLPISTPNIYSQYLLPISIPSIYSQYINISH